MNILNLPEYNFKFQDAEGKKLIYDEIRKIYVTLTPEEWVRQHFIRFLVDIKKYPATLIRVEMSLKVLSMSKRADIVLYNNLGKPILIVECKAPTIRINQQAFDQAAAYNIKLKVNYLIITNGIDHYCCKIDFINESYEFLKDIPDYNSL